MIDTMTFTKVLGGFCGALLIFLLGKWAAESLYHVGGKYGEPTQAYVIETDDGEDAAASQEEEVDFETLLASADVDAGERVFGKCRACHKITEGENATGPYLHGVVGREIGGVDSYGAYSGALSEVAEVWTPENLDGFLENPRGWAPGTTMGYAGLSDPEDRANLIAYLNATDG